MSLLETFTEEEKLALQEYGLSHNKPSQLADSFILGVRHQKSEPVSFEDFVGKHNKLQYIMEEYGLSVDLIKQSFEIDLLSLVELSKYSKKLEK